MKSRIYFKRDSQLAVPHLQQGIKSALLIVLMLCLLTASLLAQQAQFTRPSWFFGAAAGANVNFFRGSTQQLSPNFTPPVTFHNGVGAGLYLAPAIEYHAPGTGLGFMLQAGYDSRRGDFDQQLTDCNCPADLSTDLAYFTIEPSLRWAPGASQFYLFGGPRFAFNVSKSFTYSLGINPAYPEQELTPDVNGDISEINNNIVSMQLGAGYDIYLSSRNRQTQFVLSPFVAYHPYFGQDPRTVETWNLNTLRIGAALKLGRGRLIPAPVEVILVKDPEVRFSIVSPGNIPKERNVHEVFPMRNYVFFDPGSTAIPERYTLLKKSQVKDFKEDQLEFNTPKNMSGRSSRQMIVYYNILNILGDRLGRNPLATINLVGSSEEGPLDGQQMANSIKNYLVDVFGINASRINTTGQDKPDLPSEQPGATKELLLLREGDRRVSIETGSPELLMEFQSGPQALLKPVHIMATQEAPLDSYVSFEVDGGQDPVSSWSLDIIDNKSVVQSYGPFYKKKVSIPGKSILGSRANGDFIVRMTGLTKSGKAVRKESPMHMVLWTPLKDAEGMRYSILYEFDDSKAIAQYEKYLTEVVVAKIPVGATVIIHGYTDIIGDEMYNGGLSMDRANDVRKILEAGLKNANRRDVRFEIYGFGEDESMSPFDNSYPEERFYNRTVIIDIIPKS